ncbi:MAG: hypothetical protein ACREYE_33975 [Gammaproteobacteria bacterium]
MKKPTALGISRSGGARNPHVFNIHCGSCAPAERDLPSLATVFHKLSDIPSYSLHLDPMSIKKQFDTL